LDNDFYAEQKNSKVLTLQDIDDDLFDGNVKYARFVNSAMKSHSKLHRDRNERVEASELELDIAEESSIYMIRILWSINQGCVHISNTCPLDAVNFVFFNLNWIMSCNGIKEMADKKSLYYRAKAIAKAKKFNEWCCKLLQEFVVEACTHAPDLHTSHFEVSSNAIVNHCSQYW